MDITLVSIVWLDLSDKNKIIHFYIILFNKFKNYIIILFYISRYLLIT